MISSRSLAAALLGLVTAVAPVPAQTHWTVDPKTSLAWWQMSPNMNHLWATTCPADSSWRPGENRSSGWVINPKLKLPRSGYGNVDDTVHVPLYPRHTVQPDCVEAVRGEVVVPDTVHWRGVHGTGTLTIRGVQKAVTAALQAFPDGGGLRVLAKWRFPAPLLLLDFTPKLSYLGLGANTLIWHDIFMGADLVFRPEAPGAN